MLALRDPNRDFWMVTLSSLVGYVMPSPQMGNIKPRHPPTLHQFTIANQVISMPQYAWKQDVKKRGWFPDKETCLNHYEQHCEQHGEQHGDKPVYLYKRVVIPDGWTPSIMKSNYESFRWQVKVTQPDQPDWTLVHGPSFQNPKNCLRHFKKMLQVGFDVPTPTYYLVMRRCLPQMTEKDS